MLPPRLSSGAMTFTHTQLEFMQKAWPGMVLGILSVGVLGLFPRQWIQNILGDGKTVSGIVRATLAGVLFDMCSHGVLMVAMKLYERGASYGQVVAFLLATPWNSLSLTLILWGLIGLKLTLIFTVCSMVVGVVTGLLCQWFESKGWVCPQPVWVPSISMEAEKPEAEISDLEISDLKGVLLALKQPRKWLWQGVLESRMVLRWVLLGAVLSGLIRATVPIDSFAMWFGPTLAGLGLTLVAATIIEICSEGSVPIAADLVTRAGAAGNGFAFLMAGVSTDITELLAVKDQMKSLWAALLIPVLTVPQVLMVAWLLNQ